MALTDFSVNKLQFWAEVAGFQIELVMVDLRYELNTIPTAVLSCAIGRDVETGLAATIHFAIQDLDVNLPITVFCQAAEVNNSGVSGGIFPVGPFIAFNGRVVGIGYQKSRAGGATLQLHCIHFLADLEYWLTNTKTTHPINMGAGNMNCGINIPDGSSPNFVIHTSAKNRFTRDNLFTDYWGKSLQPWLRTVTQLQPVFQGDDISTGQGAVDARIALDRIEPGAAVGGKYKFGVPLPFDDFDVLSFNSAIQAIAAHAAELTFSKSFHSTTIWEKLTQEFTSNMLFAVAPMANRALVVPFIPGLRDIWLTIDPDEYETILLETELPRATRGVVIYTGTGSMAGAYGFMKGQAGAIRTPGGLFESQFVNPGAYIFREGPLWLTGAVFPPNWAPCALAAKAVKGNMANPGAGGGPCDGIQPRDVRFAAENMWDAFAHGIYLYEVLKCRKGSLTGRMRFDVCPGSSVEVVMTEEKFVEQQVPGVIDQSLFGMVTKVRIVYDADTVQGQTAIEFAYLRNEGENDTDLSTSAHPLYATTWLGAPLCEEQFP